MLIFNRFPSREDAQAFAFAVRDSYQLCSMVCTDMERRDRSNASFKLDLPAVLVHRSTKPGVEDHVIKLAANYHGRFAGT
ncbi:MAG: hypothetical protein H3C27_15410 [Opitutaceae bacterium]|nr:hypothetical protein [Opitutaceae bacterium]